MMDLGQWQSRLAQHFLELRATRHADGFDRPIFALEHGLDQGEVLALATAVRAHVARSAPLREHALPWIVYAAEVGYRYSGDEYWQTFEHETLGWTLRGDRSWIRDCYRSFHTRLGGAKPSGAWAEHFSIICWPITHAILPLDLQRQLAHVLYDLRHRFSAELLGSPVKLGALIAAGSWNATSRFQNLAQETLLVGQIATALLLEGEAGSANLIHSSTLSRIREDLDRERKAREWLRRARESAEKRARIRGLSSGQAPSSRAARRTDDARAEVAALGIEPRLVLRPTEARGTSWDVSLEIPDLSNLLFRFPEAREIIAGSRCVVAGAAVGPRARGWLLGAARQVPLARWPRADEVLLQFERQDAQLEYLLHTECLLRPGPTWLFRVASDGLAYELRSLRVRPNERYVIITTEGPLVSHKHARPIALGCQGVHGAILELPPALTSDWEETLRTFGLEQAKTIEVWPAGLAAAAWDGEGRGEWLASERPCLGIRTDHPIEQLLLSIGESIELSLDLGTVPPGEPTFVELPQLPVGVHTVRVLARQSLERAAEPLGDLDVVMRIREAQPWLSGLSPHGPLLVHMDPTAPTLEQLWEGRVEVILRGPRDRRVKCTASLFEKDAVAPTISIQLPPLTLPVTGANWRGYFQRHFREKATVQNAYDTARLCELAVSAEELGEFSVRFERAFTPLRWAVRRRGQGHLVRLLDDSGSATPPSLTRLTFEAPCVEEPLTPGSEYDAPAAGGLYVARLGGDTAAVIVPPVIHGLADLRCAPRIDGGERSTESLLRALKLARLWGRARLTGGLFSAIRQRDVLRAFTRHILGILGGTNWADAELSFNERTNGLARLKESVSRRREEAAFGEAIALECAGFTTVTSRQRVERLAALAAKYLMHPPVATLRESPRPTALAQLGRDSPEDPRWLSELALRLASDPAGVETWAGPQFRTGIGRLLEQPTLARGARFLVIAVDVHLQSRAGAGELYAGWRWT